MGKRTAPLISHHSAGTQSLAIQESKFFFFFVFQTAIELLEDLQETVLLLRSRYLCSEKLPTNTLK